MIFIRKANEGDAGVAWEIRNAAIDSQCTGHYRPEDLKLWTAGEVTDKFVQDVVENFYVAVLDDQVIGTGMIDLESGKVDAIFVHPGYMRTGAGKQILLHLENLAVKAGLTRLNLDSTLNASAFYRACGFVGDKIAKYKSPRGMSLDCIPMEKIIGNDA